MIIKWEEQWDEHLSVKFIILQGDKVIGSAGIEICDKFIKLVGAQVQPKYRKQGYYKQLVKLRIEHYNNMDTEECLLAKVRRDNHNYKYLTNIGFELHEKEGIYDWLYYE